MVSIAADGRSGRSTTSSTGRSLRAARVASAAPRPWSSTGGWMPRARSRSSVMASLAPRWAASTSSRTRSRSACTVPLSAAAELLPGQAQLHGDGDHLGLRSVVQVPLDPAQPRRRVLHHVGPGLLQLTHPAGRCPAAGGRRSRRSAPPLPAAAIPAKASGPVQGAEASRTTPRTTLKMPQAMRTPTARRGRRYSHDLTRNLMRTGREGGTLSAGACIGIPPVTCGAGHSGHLHLNARRAREQEIHRAATRILRYG